MDHVIKKTVIPLICGKHRNSCCSAALVMHDQVAQILVVVRVLIGGQLV